MTKCDNCGSEGASYDRAGAVFCNRECYEEYLCDEAEELCDGNCDGCQIDDERCPQYEEAYKI